MIGTDFHSDLMEGLSNTRASIVGVVPISGEKYTEAHFHRSGVCSAEEEWQ